MKVSKVNLDQARIAMQQLSIVSDMESVGGASVIQHNYFTELVLIGGNVLTFELYRSEDNKLSILHSFGTIGAESERHNHRVVEIFTVLEGKMKVELDGGEHILGPTEVLRIPLDAWHKVTFLDNTWLTVQSIPAIALTKEEISSE